jgi:hypothetical protein
MIRIRIVEICFHQSHHQGRSQLIAIIKPLRPAHWGILRWIHLGVMDRPIHSVKAALQKRGRHCKCLNTCATFIIGVQSSGQSIEFFGDCWQLVRQKSMYFNVWAILKWLKTKFAKEQIQIQCTSILAYRPGHFDMN